MKSRLIIFQITILIFAVSCKKREESTTDKYSEKANEIIFQTIEQTKCSCIGKIPTESMVEFSSAENPSYDFKTVMKKQLNVKSDSELDSLINLSRNFKLNIQKLNKYKIKLVSEDDILTFGDTSIVKYERFVKNCPKGIIFIQKPIFDKKYEKAVFEFSYGFSCTKVLPSPVYKLENGKWNRIKK
jgi:hypothetical protein